MEPPRLSVMNLMGVGGRGGKEQRIKTQDGSRFWT